MTKPKSVRNCRTPKQFKKAVRNQGGRTTEGTRHTMFSNDDVPGKVACPRHGKDMATGTRFSIIKGLLKLGFVIALISWVLDSLFGLENVLAMVLEAASG